VKRLRLILVVGMLMPLIGIGTRVLADQPVAAVTISGSLPGKQIKVNGVTMHVFDQGSGPAVLLVHGLPDSSGVWKYQVPPLVKAGYRVIVPDLVGYGESDKPTALKHYEGAQVAKDLVALLDKLGIRQVDYVGHDWGAQFGWWMVMTYPDRVRRFVTLTVGHPILTASASFEQNRWDWYMLLDTVPLAPKLYKANNCSFLRMVIATHPDVDEVVSHLCKQPEGLGPVLAWDIANPMASAWLDAQRPGWQSTFPEVRTPTLGIGGGKDVFMWESQLRDTGKYLKGPWRYELIPDASHWAMLDHPKQVTELILEWLSAK
jgi:pimeloyl-ACP methyl ester carboxylesterase